MPTYVTRTLVSTLARLNADFPEMGEIRNRTWMSAPGIMAAPYQVDLEAMNKLARFLAENTSTTQRNDDDSRVLLLTPWTKGDTEISNLAARLKLAEPSGRGASRGQTLRRLADLRAELDRLEACVQTNAPGGQWDVLQTTTYEWPVFGARAVSEAETPEAYYDAVARDIRRTGAVVLSAGICRVPLPEGLAASMSGGQGLSLLAHRVAQTAKA